MKKICCLVLFCLLSTGCQSDYRSGPLWSGAASKPSVKTSVERPATEEIAPRSGRDFGVPVALKAHGENFVTYEYKNVRVDQLMPLAQKYCKARNEAYEATLRDIILYRNNLRRATFDCR